ncbi:hypothetical protein [Bacillus sp. SA1-12]|uniref:hypothetical protein n=1 Tax=Bacillus sp. SA1-12 TaxID=1455638 RepID=UPI000697981E|nr:hypothetical protein [Bacillus sp. SA1-12]
MENVYKRFLSRKVITASITGPLFTIILCIIEPNVLGGGAEYNKVGNTAIETIPFYLMLFFPVILIYGTLTSFISDIISEGFTKTNKSFQIVSAILHLIFGAVYWTLSLTAASIFFIIDRLLLQRKNVYRWKEAIYSLILPLLVFIIFYVLR